MSSPNMPPDIQQRVHHLWLAASGWWRAGVWSRVHAGSVHFSQRLTQWWQSGPWYKAAILAVVPVLAACTCCSGSLVFSMTPYGHQLARQTAATETVQAEGQATANASATQYALLHPAPTATLRPTPVPRPTSTPLATPTPTGQASYPVCNDNVTNTPCVQYATFRDAVAGESEVGANAATAMQGNAVWVHEDVTNVPPSPLEPATTLDDVQLQCFNLQQALWWGLRSTINSDGSQTFRKSPFSEVDISFFDSHIGTAAFASCRLTSAGVDRIDKAGMWDDGDYKGAWSLYDGTTYT